MKEKFLQSFGSGVELDTMEGSETAQQNEIDEAFDLIKQDELAEAEQTPIKEDATVSNEQPTMTKEE